MTNIKTRVRLQITMDSEHDAHESVTPSMAEMIACEQIRRTLEHVAEEIENGKTSGDLRDLNGKSAGSWERRI